MWKITGHGPYTSNRPCELFWHAIIQSFLFIMTPLVIMYSCNRVFKEMTSKLTFSPLQDFLQHERFAVFMKQSLPVQ